MLTVTSRTFRAAAAVRPANEVAIPIGYFSCAAAPLSARRPSSGPSADQLGLSVVATEVIALCTKRIYSGLSSCFGAYTSARLVTRQLKAADKRVFPTWHKHSAAASRKSRTRRQRTWASPSTGDAASSFLLALKTMRNNVLNLS